MLTSEILPSWKLLQKGVASGILVLLMLLQGLTPKALSRGQDRETGHTGAWDRHYWLQLGS